MMWSVSPNGLVSAMARNRASSSGERLLATPTRGCEHLEMDATPNASFQQRTGSRRPERKIAARLRASSEMERGTTRRRGYVAHKPKRSLSRVLARATGAPLAAAFAPSACWGGPSGRGALRAGFSRESIELMMVLGVDTAAACSVAKMRSKLGYRASRMVADSRPNAAAPTNTPSAGTAPYFKKTRAKISVSPGRTIELEQRDRNAAAVDGGKLVGDGGRCRGFPDHPPVCHVKPPRHRWQRGRHSKLIGCRLQRDVGESARQNRCRVEPFARKKPGRCGMLAGRESVSQDQSWRQGMRAGQRARRRPPAQPADWPKDCARCGARREPAAGVVVVRAAAQPRVRPEPWKRALRHRREREEAPAEGRLAQAG
eukprot:scaffold65441_cov31-Tisochrysis_lutea.AAC.1